MLSWYANGIHLAGASMDAIKEDKQVILFGRNRRNRILLHQLDRSEITCVFRSAWDEEGMDELYEGLTVCDPVPGMKGVVISPLYDWAGTEEAAKALGYNQIYFFFPSEGQEDMERYIQVFSPVSSLNKVPEDKTFRYVHLVPDQKFFLPVTDMIEYGMNMQEHFFVIHSMFRAKANAEYGSWSKYRELMKEYGNVYLMHDIRPLYLRNWQKQQENLTSLLERADKIIIHSEYHMGILEDPYWEMIVPLIREKGICIPWGGFLRDHGAQTDRYIEKILQHVRLCVSPQWMRWNLICEKYPGLCQAIRLDNGISYARLTKAADVKKNIEPNLLVAHSAVAYTNAIETMAYLERFGTSCNLFCITSYGAAGPEIERDGKVRFGKRFNPVKHFMEYDEYVRFLSQMDVAVFGMDVMAGRDTIELLFWLGVKVYLKPDSQAYSRMKMFGYRVADYYSATTQTLEELLHNPDREWNRSIAAREFDPNEKVRQWRELYEYDFEQHEGEV